jgi:hypothetical protein
MIDFLVSNAAKSAYLAGVAWILGFAALFIFFAVGGIFGPINDAISIFQFLFLVPVALALHRILAVHSPVLSFGAAAAAIVAMLIIAALQLLLVLGYVRFDQTLRPILLLGAILGLWWLVTSILALIYGALPPGLAWVGIVAGVGHLLTAPAFLVWGQEHPLTAIGFLVVAVAVPVWAFWLGKVLAASPS